MHWWSFEGPFPALHHWHQWSGSGHPDHWQNGPVFVLKPMFLVAYPSIVAIQVSGMENESFDKLPKWPRWWLTSLGSVHLKVWTNIEYGHVLTDDFYSLLTKLLITSKADWGQKSPVWNYFKSTFKPVAVCSYVSFLQWGGIYYLSLYVNSYWLLMSA